MPATHKDPKTGLTEQQEVFVREYVRNGGNGTKAALEAGYAESSAHTRAWEVLQKDHVLKALRIEQTRYIDSQASTMFDVIKGIALDDDAPASVKLQAALAWSDRAGYKHVEKQEVMDSRSPAEQAERAKELTAKLALVK